MSTNLIAIYHVVLLALPGALLSFRLVPGLPARLLLAMAVSFATAVFIVAAAKRLSLSLEQACTVWGVVVVVFTLATFWLTRQRRPWEPPLNDASARWFLSGLLVVIAGTVVYHSVVGAYLEIPADVLAHLNYSQSAWLDLDDGSFERDAIIGIHHDKAADYWYYLHATIAHLAGTTIHDSVEIVSMVNTTAFIVATYAMAHVVFAHRSAPERTVIALLSAVFFIVHFGTNIFAFIRYYAFAPVMLNMLVFFGAMSLVLTLKRHRVSYAQVWWLTFLTTGAALVHMQEAMFIATMTLGLWVYFYIQVRRTPQDKAPNNWRRGLPIELVVPISLVGLAVLMMAVHVLRDRFDLFEPRIISIETYLPFLKHLYILNPVFQFYEVVTVFGVWLYVMFVVFKARLYRNAYLTVGMLIPIFTVFNPFFVDFFLRLTAGHTLWRLCFLIPLPFMAAWLVVHLAAMARFGSLWRRSAGSVALIVTVALLWPYNSSFFVAPHSRIGHLMPIPSPMSINALDDLTDVLTTQTERRDVITDPVTGYILGATTVHRAMRKKFFTPRVRQLDIAYLSNSDNRQQHQDDLIVINQRDGPVSHHGRLSRHWPEHILEYTRHYDESLLTLVTERDDWFEKIWEQDRIRLYRIR